MTSGMSKRLSAFGVVIALASCATELPQPSMPPAAPAGLMALPGDRSISLRWDDPRDADIASYEVRLRAELEANWRPWRSIADSSHGTTSHTLPNLTAGARYQIQVRALNAAGPGEPSQTLATPRPLAPVAPAGLTALAGDGSISIAWNDPGDASIVSYEFRFRRAGEPDWPRWQAIPGSARMTSHTLRRGLSNGALYQIQVRARNAAGASPASDASATPRPPAPTGAPPAAPAGLTALAGDHRIDLAWDDPGNAGITSYEFRLRGPGDADWRSWRTVADSTYLTTGQTLPGLSNGVLYRIQVRARTAAGPGEPREITATPRASAQPEK